MSIAFEKESSQLPEVEGYYLSIPAEFDSSRELPAVHCEYGWPIELTLTVLAKTSGPTADRWRDHGPAIDALQDIAIDTLVSTHPHDERTASVFEAMRLGFNPERTNEALPEASEELGAEMLYYLAFSQRLRRID